MNKALLIPFALILCLMLEPVPCHGFDRIDGPEKAELAKAWQTFLNAVSANDIRTIRNLSAEKIRCLACVDNTDREDEEMTRFRATDPDWYETLYREKIFIPVEVFCEQDYPLVFSEPLKRRMREKTPVFAVEDFDGRKLHVVIVQTSEPGEFSPRDEGVVHLFQFVKTDHGYRFWGIDTIP
ncbi:MAG TPA: hypothetical protein PLO63_06430 [Syntrophales bacterium]|nr:hypothetical protein [Syntrophales bacterium]